MLKQFMWYCVDADGEKNSKVTKSAVYHCGKRYLDTGQTVMHKCKTDIYHQNIPVQHGI